MSSRTASLLDSPAAAAPYRYATPDDTHDRAGHTPALDCYVIGCKHEPVLSIRHKQRRRTIVQACSSHDPRRFDQDAPIFPGVQPPAAQAAPETTTDDGQAEQPKSRDERIGEILRTLLAIAAQPDDTDQDDDRGGRTVPRPTPPTRPTPPALSRPVDDLNF